MKINFTSFLVTEALIYAALVIALVDSCVRITKGSITISQALIRFNAFLQLFFFCTAADERFPQCFNRYFRSR